MLIHRVKCIKKRPYIIEIGIIVLKCGFKFLNGAYGYQMSSEPENKDLCHLKEHRGLKLGPYVFRIGLKVFKKTLNL